MPSYVITEHAEFEMERRGLSRAVVAGVVESPEQQVPVRPGRIVLQSRIAMDEPAKVYLVRVFLDVDREPNEVVTAYRTSRIAKYWREEP